MLVPLLLAFPFPQSTDLRALARFPAPGEDPARTAPPLRSAPPGPVAFTYSLGRNNPRGSLACLAPESEKGPHAITEIRFRIEAPDIDAALRQAVIRLEFDDERTVACRLGDLFAGPGPPEPAWPVQIGPGTAPPTGMPAAQVELACEWVMPYRERFDLSIDNRGSRELHVSGSIRTEPWGWDERSLHFHARSRTLRAVDAEIVDERPLWTVSGTGVLVGGIGVGPAFLRVDGADVGPLASGREPVPFAKHLVLDAGRARDSSTPAMLVYYARPGARDDAPVIRQDDLALPSLSALPK